MAQQQNQILKVDSTNNLPGHRINMKLDDGTTVQFSELVRNAISDVKKALIVNPDNSTRFSRVKQSSNFLENGSIKFEGFNEGKESLNELKEEFHSLHDAICLLHDRPFLRNILGVMSDFRNFLLSLSRINEYTIYVLMSERERIRDLTMECSDYILGDSNIINLPDYSIEGDLELDSMANDLIGSTINLSNSLEGGRMAERVKIANTA